MEAVAAGAPRRTAAAAIVAGRGVGEGLGTARCAARAGATIGTAGPTAEPEATERVESKAFEVDSSKALEGDTAIAQGSCN